MAEKIRINFKAYSVELLDETVKNIVSIVNRTGGSIKGPIALPTKIHRLCVLRSPHVDKKSREQFEVRIHKKLMYILDASPATMSSLQELEVSAGIKLTLKY